jgi:RNA polymerase sigma-70 factor (ECF subfamily)
MVAVSSVITKLAGPPKLSDTFAARLVPLPLEGRRERSSAETLVPKCDTAALSDECLVVSVAGGNREAVSTLFKRYARLTFVIGRRILRDDAEAEDVVQEVFLYIHRRSSIYDSARGSARSWILQIAYTQALMRRRDLNSHGLYASAIGDKHKESETAGKSATEYEGSVEGLFGRAGWRKAFESLTPDQQQTLRLHFFEGYTFAEIAEKLGQSYGNIRNHHYRSLEKLRGLLADRD